MDIKNGNVHSLIENFQIILTNFSREECESNEVSNDEREKEDDKNSVSDLPLNNTTSEISLSYGAKSKAYSCENC